MKTSRAGLLCLVACASAAAATTGAFVTGCGQLSLPLFENADGATMPDSGVGNKQPPPVNDAAPPSSDAATGGHDSAVPNDSGYVPYDGGYVPFDAGDLTNACTEGKNPVQGVTCCGDSGIACEGQANDCNAVCDQCEKECTLGQTCCPQAAGLGGGAKCIDAGNCGF